METFSCQFLYTCNFFRVVFYESNWFEFEFLIKNALKMRVYFFGFYGWCFWITDSCQILGFFGNSITARKDRTIRKYPRECLNKKIDQALCIPSVLSEPFTPQKNSSKNHIFMNIYILILLLWIHIQKKNFIIDS